MYRGNGVYKNTELIKKIRDQFSEAVIRSSFIVGFPGEQESDFEELALFVNKNEIESPSHAQYLMCQDMDNKMVASIQFF